MRRRGIVLSASIRPGCFSKDLQAPLRLGPSKLAGAVTSFGPSSSFSSCLSSIRPEQSSEWQVSGRDKVRGASEWRSWDVWRGGYKMSGCGLFFPLSTSQTSLSSLEPCRHYRRHLQIAKLFVSIGTLRDLSQTRGDLFCGQESLNLRINLDKTRSQWPQALACVAKLAMSILASQQ